MLWFNLSLSWKTLSKLILPAKETLNKGSLTPLKKTLKNWSFKSKNKKRKPGSSAWMCSCTLMVCMQCCEYFVESSSKRLYLHMQKVDVHVCVLPPPPLPQERSCLHSMQFNKLVVLCFKVKLCSPNSDLMVVCANCVTANSGSSTP